ncbi:MAG: RNA polymerase sigma factor [Clostridiales bacterium]|nr:RNA polymerase sigma factor [Clostridiales bacterium]
MEGTRRSERFASLCGPYAPMVYRHCLLMLKRPAEAEDAAQECMLKAFRSFDNYRGEGIARWLYRIAHNTCLDILKSARVKHEAQWDDEAPETPDSALTPDEVYQQKAEKDRLWEAVSRLNLEQQTVLTLYYGENMDYQQISEALAIAPGTVKSRLSRAKEALKKLLEENY